MNYSQLMAYHKSTPSQFCSISKSLTFVKLILIKNLYIFNSKIIKRAGTKL